MASPGRKKGAAAVLRTAPAYSFGSKWKDHDYRCGPVPAAYKVKHSSSNFQAAKSIGFGTSRRSSCYGNGNPGPQDYNPALNVTHPTPPAATIRGRPAPPGHADQEPGPGQYNADVAACRTSHPQAPAHSIGPRWPPDKEPGRMPAPGEYDPNFQAKQPLPCTLKGRWDSTSSHSSSSRDAGKCSPGPGEYRPEDSLSRGRSSSAITMGGSHPKPPRTDTLPGPGHYSPYPFPRPGPGPFPKSQRQLNSRYEVRPGPGAYFTHQIQQRPGGFSPDSLRRSAPAVTVCSRPVALQGKASPGPGEYDPRELLTRSTSPCFTFKGTAAKDHLAKNPGPGHYNPERAQLRASHPCPPSITMSPQLSPPQNCEKQPPPGEYEPERYQPWGDRAVTMKFRHSAASAEGLHHAAPGPGDYSLPSSLRGPGFTMGARLKVKGSEQLPGPGHYELQESTLGAAAAPRLLGAAAVATAAGAATKAGVMALSPGSRR